MKATAFALCLSGSVACASPPEWLTREFTDSWNAPGHGVQEFLNGECQPSGLDGIQMIGIQHGHADVFHVHVYCRHDGDATAHYRVTMPAVPMGTIDAAVQGRLPNPNVRVGPFWFGMEGGVDGFLLVERIR